ncbi:MAG: electron transport complex subunit RsxC [Gammaproteobacteria bacterium]|nr:electron transport complex subunit RsxC [Gammaproteobacteria bacterium]
MNQIDLISYTQSSFHGGIHPAEFKTISNQTPIDCLTLSDKLYLPLEQHIGKAAKLIVQQGERIKQGQLLAEADGNFSANLHSPVNGVIESIGLINTNHPSTMMQPGIVIKIDDTSQGFTTSSSDNKDWQSLSQEDLLRQVQQAGIVGLGGATFPTHIKLAAQSVDTLAVNAMECEPYITCDDRMLQELSDQVIIGAQIAAKIFSAKQIIFAIEDNKPEALSSLEKAIIQCKLAVPMTIKVAPTKYPSGGEKQLIELVFNKQLPKNKLPVDIGVVVQNVATLQAIYQKIVKQQNLTHRLVTLTGSQMEKPGNYWVAFGTPIKDIIQKLKISDKGTTIILGGPLMGQQIDNLMIPVTKSTNCIIFEKQQNLSKPWLTKSIAHQSCIRCSDCESVCPVDLLPQQLYWYSRAEEWEKLEETGIKDCIECGACAYVCPSEIPLVQYYRFAKTHIRQNHEKQLKSEKAKQRFEFREMRLERAKAERALKHQKAAEARRKAAQDNNEDPSGKQKAINDALERVKMKKQQNQGEDK